MQISILYKKAAFKLTEYLLTGQSFIKYFLISQTLTQCIL